MSLSQIKPSELEHIRQQMLKFAQLQLRHQERAEDLVQEALLAAYQNKEHFQGQSALKTWLFAILKNKILDEFRCQKALLFSELENEEEENIAERLFLENGSWNKSAFEQNVWQSEAGAVYSAQFWQIFEAC